MLLSTTNITITPSFAEKQNIKLKIYAQEHNGSSGCGSGNSTYKHKYIHKPAASRISFIIFPYFFFFCFFLRRFCFVHFTSSFNLFLSFSHANFCPRTFSRRRFLPDFVAGFSILLFSFANIVSADQRKENQKTHKK